MRRSRNLRTAGSPDTSRISPLASFRSRWCWAISPTDRRRRAAPGSSEPAARKRRRGSRLRGRLDARPNRVESVFTVAVGPLLAPGARVVAEMKTILQGPEALSLFTDRHDGPSRARAAFSRRAPCGRTGGTDHSVRGRGRNREVAAAALREPKDIADLVALFVSPRSRFLHGALIDADGGATKMI